MDLSKLTKEYKLIDLFVQLCEIPSPSLKEKELSDFILDIFNINNIKAGYDSFGNIIAKLPATPKCKKAPPLLLSAHMDVVGGSEKVNLKLSPSEKYIETDKTRTLGADNKAGIAVILDLVMELNDLSCDIEHGPIEITFTRDEEKGMTGVRNLDTSKLNSKYAIIADGEHLAELDVESADFTNVFVKVSGGKGGHSGININDKTRINAIKVLSEIDSQIPQGVFKQDEHGVITSINAATCVGGSAFTFIVEAIKEACLAGKSKKKVDEKFDFNNILNTMSKEPMLNVISTEAQLSYSVRSSEPENEQELLNLIKQIVKDTNTKYRGFINCEVEVEQHLKPFIKSADTTLVDIIVESAKERGIKCRPGSFHAGAETNVFSNEKLNSAGEKFNPVILGVSNLHNIHSADERLDWESFLEGRKLLKDIVVKFAQFHCKS